MDTASESLTSKFGAAVAEARGRARLTQAELADLIGTTPPIISLIEWDRVRPTVPEFDSLNQLFPELSGVKPETFRTRRQTPRSMSKGFTRRVGKIRPPLAIVRNNSTGDERPMGAETSTEPQDPILGKLAPALREARKTSALTQWQVAEKVGVGQPTYSQWESGITYPIRDHFEKLCELWPELKDIGFTPSDRAKGSGNPNGCAHAAEARTGRRARPFIVVRNGKSVPTTVETSTAVIPEPVTTTEPEADPEPQDAFHLFSNIDPLDAIRFSIDAELLAVKHNGVTRESVKRLHNMFGALLEGMK